ncbi:unnamed protein product [Rotaria sp. Silwood2]|nr:unnamed protein product [Rotaria sp. Silwood2]CAF2634356.1 unnamed protein product [Rotaria sp. Silwood2]CAF2884128.1 unnamed protein product [Rotaria sp. Silwood2]CAF3035916.1 unnamed protein product [Rotaria sp. Silwood2]
MDNSLSTPRKNELVETMFKSLNSYTSELQQEILNRKVADQTRTEQTYDTCQKQLQDDLIQLRAAIETNTELFLLNFRLHSQIVEKRQEQNMIIDKSNTAKYNHHRNMLEENFYHYFENLNRIIFSTKITEQCANLTMAFRTNYHAYARADLDEIRKKTETRLKTISDEVANTELTVVNTKDKIIELNKKLDREIIHFNYLKESIEIIAKKLQVDYEDIINFDNLEKQLTDIQTSINELEAWHIRTDYPSQEQ